MLVPAGYSSEDVIVAVATAPGDALRKIVRLSGNHSIVLAESVFKFRHRRNVRRVHGQVSLRDPISATDMLIAGTVQVWPTARSFTGQPAAEFHAPIPEPLLKAVIEKCERAGARLAQPGEFTLRAFLAGKLDLTQAEGLLEVIHAHSDDHFERALRQLAGGLAGQFREVREDLLDLLADLEAGLDFVEEGLEFVTDDRLRNSIREALQKLTAVQQQLSGRGGSGPLPTVVLLGRPNAGKSSLFNALCAAEKAIVSPQAGTTRDYLTCSLEIGGFQFELVDTAGTKREEVSSQESHTGESAQLAKLDDFANASADMRAGETAGEMAEKKTREVRQTADLSVHCVAVDDVPAIDAIIKAHSSHDPATFLLVITKGDLISSFPCPTGAIVTSATSGTGLNELRQLIVEHLAELNHNGIEAAPSTMIRCGSSLKRGIAELSEALQNFESGMGEEVVAADIRLALDAIGEISGAVVTDEVLGRIFSRFCIGK